MKQGTKKALGVAVLGLAFTVAGAGVATADGVGLDTVTGTLGSLTAQENPRTLPAPVPATGDGSRRAVAGEQVRSGASKAGGQQGKGEKTGQRPGGLHSSGNGGLLGELPLGLLG